MKSTTITDSHKVVRPLISRLAVSLLSGVFATLAAPAQADELLDRPIQIDIQPNTPLEDALIEWGERAHVTIMINTQTVARLVANEVHGTHSAREALALLLRGSGLSYQDKGGRVKVAPTEALVRSKLGELDYSTLSPTESDFSSGSPMAKDDLNNTPNRPEHNGMSEVVVSAEKREGRLQDVPVPVTAISADSLLQNNLVSIQDYYTQVPGLSLMSDFRGSPELVIRGLAVQNGFSNPTVGILIDDAPIGSSTGLGGGSTVPDIDPSDLQRVEVLRGPQGTLYGASSVGGLVKFVTVDPSTSGMFGSLQAGVSSVYSGTEAGYSVRGSLNIPLSDTLALRASVYSRRDPGYIDDVLTGQHGVNRVDAEGARVSMMWRPVDSFSMKLSGLYQYSSSEGNNYSDALPGVGILQQSSGLNLGANNHRIQVYTAIAKLKLGSSELTSISTYSSNDLRSSDDSTYYYGTLAQGAFNVPAALVATPLLDQTETTKYTEELRVSTAVNSKLDSLVGIFFTHEHSPYLQQVLGTNAYTDEVYGSVASFAWVSSLTEYAAFADFTVHVVDRFDIEVGGRESRIDQQYHEGDTGLFFGPDLDSTAVNPQVSSDANAFTYLITPSYKITPHVMTYARFASGYRAGGPNQECSILGVPCVYQPDKTKNYEVGVKGDVADHLLDVDLSLYYIQWKNLQLAVSLDGLGFNANGGSAKSQGVEVTVSWRPVSGLRFSAWGSYNDATLSEALPPDSQVYGVAGNRLPLGSRLSGSLSMDDEFLIRGTLSGFVGSQIAYVGERLGPFNGGAGPRTIMPGYYKPDVHAGLRFDPWSVTLYCNNITDQRGVLTSGQAASLPFQYVYIQPRTVGLLFTRTF